MARQLKPTYPLRTVVLIMPNGRVLDQGDEFTVKGEGRFAFRYGWNNGNEATCWGPVGSKAPSWRTFRATDITTIHRTKTQEKT